MRWSSAFMLVLLFAPGSHAADLTIGLIPEQNVFVQMERYEPIGKYLEEQTGIGIRFVILPRYGDILQHFTDQKMDAAFLGSFTGAIAIRELGIEPIARPLWNDGSSTYHGLIFVRKDSGIKDVTGMRGRSIVFVSRATTAGYVFPLAYFREKGVDNVDSYFREHYFSGSHDAAVYAVLEREAEIGCAKNTIFEHLTRNDPRVSGELTVLAESPRVPSNGLAVRRDLDPGIRGRIREVILGMDSSPKGMEILKKFGAIKFIETSKQSYDPVFDMIRKAGMEPGNRNHTSE